MIIKGLDKSYLKCTNMTIDEIVNEINTITESNIRTITIRSAGWDAMFGNYVTIRAYHNKLWIIYDGQIIENNGWIKERDL